MLLLLFLLGQTVRDEYTDCILAIARRFIEWYDGQVRRKRPEYLLGEGNTVRRLLIVGELATANYSVWWQGVSEGQRRGLQHIHILIFGEPDNMRSVRIEWLYVLVTRCTDLRSLRFLMPLLLNKPDDHRRD